jgi:hypothetical protein
MSEPHSSSLTSDPPAPKHKYTSLASLMKDQSPAKSKAKGHDRRGSRSGAEHSGWNLPSVEEQGDHNGSRGRSHGRDATNVSGKKEKKGRLSLWKMMALTVSMGGSQVYTPFSIAMNVLM